MTCDKEVEPAHELGMEEMPMSTLIHYAVVRYAKERGLVL